MKMGKTMIWKCQAQSPNPKSEYLKSKDLDLTLKLLLAHKLRLI